MLRSGKARAIRALASMGLIIYASHWLEARYLRAAVMRRRLRRSQQKVRGRQWGTAGYLSPMCGCDPEDDHVCYGLCLAVRRSRCYSVPRCDRKSRFVSAPATDRGDPDGVAAECCVALILSFHDHRHHWPDAWFAACDDGQQVTTPVF